MHMQQWLHSEQQRNISDWFQIKLYMFDTLQDCTLLFKNKFKDTVEVH